MFEYALLVASAQASTVPFGSHNWPAAHALSDADRARWAALVDASHGYVS